VKASSKAPASAPAAKRYVRAKRKRMWSFSNPFTFKTNIILVMCGVVYWLGLFVYMNPRNDVALLDAIVEQDLQAARRAFDDGATMRMPIRRKNTFLHAAALHGQVEMAKLLVVHGAERSLNAINDEGLTPLDVAITQKHREMALYLRSLGKGNSEHLP